MSHNIFEKNLEKYADPEMYDHLYDRYQKDLNIILKWAEKDQTIIELACGTGRLTIPMAQRGFQMIGVDLHEGMLARARQKAEEQGIAIDFVQQDCTELNLPVKSSLAFMTGNSFQHFLTNEAQDALFQYLSKHLKDGGIFIFDTRNPVLKELSVVDEYEDKYVDKNGKQVIESHRDGYDHLTQILDCRTHRRFYRDSTLIAEEQDGISLRYSFPKEMERLIAANGFDIVHIFGDWDGDELHANSVSMVYVCRIKTV
ncbi:methyltransferase domain-containing protein [Sporosarcina thermotolerans]|uniref:class I SAM-dependent methyltransferase n=1 Tax=Sporosarcina thermotolerans TaxID=633404 RepID=UPI0024BC1031|nr:class I SAM-dependent methyltransferase [Sporosarcina thermotolerans]WHT48480.1 methyltransferase domain-containing protein [Sporosarcina thermotolerans]